MRLFDIGAICEVLVISLIAAEGKPGRHNDIHPARILCERPEPLIGRLVGDQVKAEEHLFTEGKALVLLFCEVACVGYGFGRAQVFKLHIAGKTALGLHTGPTCRIGCRTFVIRNHAESLVFLHFGDNAAAHARTAPKRQLMLCRPHFVALRRGRNENALHAAVQIALNANIRELAEQGQGEIEFLILRIIEHLALGIFFLGRKLPNPRRCRIDYEFFIPIPVEALIHGALNKTQGQIDTAVPHHGLLLLEFIVVNYRDFISRSPEELCLADAHAARPEAQVPERKNQRAE